MNDTRTGLIAALLAYTAWGFFPLYFIALRDTSANEIFSHRILWAVPVGALIIWARSQGKEVIKGLQTPQILLPLALTALLVGANWLIYIVAVHRGQIFEASLGYYINPLMYMLVGTLFLGEPMRRPQLIAIGCAALGVLVLTVYGGKLPVIALFLATSFTIYGLIRKQLSIGAMPGLFIETLILAPFAGLYLWWLIHTTDTSIETASFAKGALLAFAGPATVLPLLMFAIAARRLTLASLGFLQFIGPSIQFVIGL
ncbi:MAG: EamA family transporter RarD, partial [Pseudomonadota bacterium]